MATEGWAGALQAWSPEAGVPLAYSPERMTVEAVVNVGGAERVRAVGVVTVLVVVAAGGGPWPGPAVSA